MKTEFEVKVPNINYDKLKSHLLDLWAKQIQEKLLFKRVAFRHPTKENHAYIRVRDEGTQITCTYKEVDRSKDVDAVKEIEFIVSEFDSCIQFLKAIGLEQKAYQETRREIREFNGAQITFDEWPWLKPFIEIEWSSIEQVEGTANLLGYEKKDMIFGAVDEIYFQELWIPYDVINNMAVITFENPPEKFTNQ